MVDEQPQPQRHEIEMPLIANMGTTLTPTLTQAVVDTVALAVVLAFLGIVITVAGVLVATGLRRGPVIYAVASLIVVVGVVFVPAGRTWAIRSVRRLLPELPRH